MQRFSLGSRLLRRWMLLVAVFVVAIAGFAVFDAEDLNAAIERVSQTPCAMAHGVVEVWPLAT